MATKIYAYDGRLVASIADSTLDSTSTSIRIPGNYYENYGQSVMESIVWTMQNFAGGTAPTAPITGQSWYDSAERVLKIYDGNTWTVGSSVLVNDAQPIARNKGELWYDNLNKQLRIWSGTVWDLVGPLGSAINADPISNLIIPDHSAFESIKLSDGVNAHQVWRWTIGGIVVAILSLDPVFVPSPSLTGFSAVYPGLNFNSTVAGAGVSGDPTLMRVTQTNIPTVDNSYDLGTSALSFRNLYSANGLFRTSLGVGGSPGIYTFRVTGTSQFTSAATFSSSAGVGGGPGAYTFRVIGTSQFTSTAEFASTVSFGSTINLAVGTATVAPIVFNPGLVLTTPTTGAIEFNGSGLFATLTVGGVPTRKTVLTSGNVVIANSGDTAAAPGLTWADNTNTGLFNPTNSVAITTNGAEKLRVNDVGAVGIGGANYGNAGDSLVTQGAGASVEWIRLVPAGALMPYAGLTAPTGWLFCYGQSLSTTAYADLFAAIGYTYGGAGGSFNLPDLRGRSVAGKDDMGGVSANRLTGQSGGVNGDILGGTGGAETHTLTIAEMPAHTHTLTAALVTDNTESGAGDREPSNSTITTDPTGGDGAHNNVQPTIILNYIIKI